MDKNTLVVYRDFSDEMEYSGRFLLSKMSRERVLVSGAFWYFYSEDMTWRFIIISQQVEATGTSKIYDVINAINKTTHSKKYKKIPLSMVEVKSQRFILYKSLKRSFYIEEGGVRLRNTMLDGLEISDMFIYKII